MSKSSRLLQAFFFLLLVVAAAPALAWDNHDDITRGSVSEQWSWPSAEYVPIEKAIADPVALQTNLGIRPERVRWNWVPGFDVKAVQGRQTSNALAILLYSVMEADHGMDQDLRLSEDQKYMGGYEGLSSQGIRHMYYRPFRWREPLVTFHFPFHEMGFAPERAQTYFDLAVDLARQGELFWAYRFLGFGLHYVQDLAQPYHASQFASLKLLPLHTLRDGWNAFIQETTRLVSNFHLSFEQWAGSRMKQGVASGDDALSAALFLPSGDDQLRQRLTGDAALEIEDGAKLLAIESSRLAPALAVAQDKVLGAALRAPGLELGQGFTDADGKPKVDLSALDGQEGTAAQALSEFRHNAVRGLSNTGVATRWYLDQFEAAAKLKK